MQLLYEILMVAGPAAASAAAALLARRRRQKLKELPPPEEKEDASAPTPPQAPPPPSPARPPKLTDAELIEAVTTHVAFSIKEVQVGVEEIGRRVIGYRAVESDVPEEDFDIQPMTSPSQRLSLLPGESTKPPEVAMVRMLTGQAMIAQPLRAEPITEPITRPIMRALKHTVYVLLDISGSMFSPAWRIRIGKGVALGLARRCRKEGSTFLFRSFSHVPHDLYEVSDDQQQADFEVFLSRVTEGGGTAIGAAIDRAINDCLQQKFDSCDIMIVTDGEDEGINVANLRAQLAYHNIRLHAILLDVNNAALREAANVSQHIPEPGVVQPPIIRDVP